jgi:hypothetical protein
MSEKIVTAFIHKYSRLPTERDPDYLEMLRMSKYRVLAVPDASPGKCANCGASKNDERQYIDIGQHIDFYGAIFLCTLCLKDMAQTAGLFREYDNNMINLASENDKLQMKLEQGVALPDNLVKAWEEFKEYYASVHLTSVVPPDDPITDPVSVEESGKSGTDKAESGIEGSNPKSVKSTSSSRRANVPSLADLLKNSGS